MRTSELLRELFRRAPFLAGVGALNFVLFGCFFIFSLFDSRTILGLDPWVKPMKFALSIGIYLWTIGWIIHHLGLWLRRILGLVIGSTMILEITAIALQSARGVQSHFNQATAFDAIIFSLMGLMILANTIAVAIVLIAFIVKAPDISPGYLWGIRLGIVGFLLASGVGGIMIRNMAHAVGVADGGPGLPFVNWSTEGGDLRVAYFLGLHALQLLPLTGFLLDRKKPGRWVWIFAVAAAWTAATLFLCAQALEGNPFVALR